MSELAEKIKEAIKKNAYEEITHRFYPESTFRQIDKVIDEHNRPTGEAIERAKEFYNQFPIHKTLKSLEEEETFIHHLMVQFHNSEMERAIPKNPFDKILEPNRFRTWEECTEAIITHDLNQQLVK